jgi:hypothetical protein
MLPPDSFSLVRTQSEVDMRFIGKRVAIVALAGVLSVSASRTGVAQSAGSADVVTIETIKLQLYRANEPKAVPVAKRETKSRYPGGKEMWVPGFWNLEGDRSTDSRAGWVWVPGRWITPPERNARWEPAHWGMLNEWWSWMPGHWVVPGRYGYPPELSTANLARLKASQEDQE